MFPDLPEHLQTLNALPGNSPPSAAMNAEQEEAFWGFLHADELFRNFGSAPSPTENNDDEKRKQQLHAPAPAPTPATVATPASSTKEEQRPTLESFLAAYMGHSSGSATQQATTAQTISNYLMPLPAPYATPVQTLSQTPAAVTTQDVMPSVSSGRSASVSLYDEDDDKPSGAKKLKSLGANQGEIEEDKRRRNTEASARFRAKKKEREQALERRAKELENQVSALAAENTSLENENRLLKAIVLNGSNPAAAALATAGTGSQDVSANESLQAALAALGKRKRDE
ncbi:hypothetical protein B9479_003301 [Cryptococcus floricola]|uniref:BZIP domain-containing protein n=1 Tax=Cryptococcus floricola TaxID=2591691 RepID=A0A5D3AZ39_9TREE|nr:hypothetical protein B9479_003301 [Cryptococcus floricola]